MIDLTTCSKCGTAGLPTTEGHCPNCGASESGGSHQQRTHRVVSVPRGTSVIVAAWSGCGLQSLFVSADGSFLKSALAILVTLLAVIQAAAFLFWIWRTVKVLQPYDRKGKLPRPSDMLIGFFIPLFNLYWLPSVFNRIDRFLATLRNETQSQANTTPNLGIWALMLMLVTIGGIALHTDDRTGGIELTTKVFTSLILTGLILLVPRFVVTAGHRRLPNAQGA